MTLLLLYTISLAFLYLSLIAAFDYLFDIFRMFFLAIISNYSRTSFQIRKQYNNYTIIISSQRFTCGFRYQ